mmetsp:Transcript_1387/g.4358  ORF Transcript_1387/g.4358 Transcript_1387/m.4358 type:complete len:272 (-) Transcript_1387:219-1034(-)
MVGKNSSSSIVIVVIVVTPSCCRALPKYVAVAIKGTSETSSVVLLLLLLFDSFSFPFSNCSSSSSSSSSPSFSSSLEVDEDDVDEEDESFSSSSSPFIFPFSTGASTLLFVFLNCANLSVSPAISAAAIAVFKLTVSFFSTSASKSSKALFGSFNFKYACMATFMVIVVISKPIFFISANNPSANLGFPPLIAADMTALNEMVLRSTPNSFCKLNTSTHFSHCFCFLNRVENMVNALGSARNASGRSGENASDNILCTSEISHSKSSCVVA